MVMAFTRTLRRVGRCSFQQLRWIRHTGATFNLDLSIVTEENRSEVGMITLGALQHDNGPVGIAQAYLALPIKVFGLDLYRPSIIGPQGALDLVERVGAPTGHSPALATAIVVPIPQPLILELFVIWAKFGLVAPLIPI